MGKVYSVGEDKSNPKSLLATKEYVDGVAKQLTGFLVNHTNDSRAHDTLIKRSELSIDGSYTTEDLPLKIETITIGEGNGVSLTPDELLNLKNRPTGMEVSQLIANATDRIKKEFEESINKILNTNDAFSKLKDLVTILSSEDGTRLLDEVLQTRLSKDELDEHARLNTHINAEDRKALDGVVALFKSGIDWNADYGINSIKNKPDSLPANGGNADTVGGYTTEQLINKNTHDLIIGVAGAKYPASTLDLCVEVDNSNCSYIKAKIEDFSNGSIFFRNGIYRFNELNFGKGRHPSNADIILSGNKNNSILFDTNCLFNHKITVRDLCFESANIVIQNGVVVEHCEFINCNVVFDGNGSIFNYNFLNNCRVNNNSVCMNNIITYNRLINTTPILYIGPDNILQYNISL